MLEALLRLHEEKAQAGIFLRKINFLSCPGNQFLFVLAFGREGSGRHSLFLPSKQSLPTSSQSLPDSLRESLLFAAADVLSSERRPNLPFVKFVNGTSTTAL